jgi:histidine triad (HIT) family protein
MYNHAPADYVCPFCAIVRGDYDGVYTTADDIVLHTAQVTAFIGAHWWPHNAGHVIVIPNAHHENLYDLPDASGAAIHAAARRIALALKQAYGCDGVSTRQHNEPAGNQDVWHYHLHVFPRYAGDELYQRTPEWCMTTPAERLPYARQLRAARPGRLSPVSPERGQHTAQPGREVRVQSSRAQSFRARIAEGGLSTAGVGCLAQGRTAQQRVEQLRPVSLDQGLRLRGVDVQQVGQRGGGFRLIPQRGPQTGRIRRRVRVPHRQLEQLPG